MKRLIKMPNGSYARADHIQQLRIHNTMLPHQGSERFDVLDIVFNHGIKTFKCQNAAHAQNEMERIVSEVNA